jgi:hypothetical protein
MYRNKLEGDFSLWDRSSASAWEHLRRSGWPQSFKPTRWHVTGDAHDGFCYISLVKPDYALEAMEVLGPWPTVASILKSPHRWFLTADAMRDKEIAFYPSCHASAGVEAATVLHFIASRYPRMSDDPDCLAADMGEFRDSVPDYEIPRLDDVVGGVDGPWHVFNFRPTAAAVSPGRCYLQLIRKCHVEEVYEALGDWPTIHDVVSINRRKFRCIKETVGLQLGAAEGPDTFRAHDVLRGVSMSVVNPVEDSFAAWTQAHQFRFPLMSKGLPALHCVLGGGVKPAAVDLTYFHEPAVPVAPPISLHSCERALEDAIDAWGFPCADDTEDQVLSGMTEVLVSGSSNSVFENASICVNGKQFRLSVFVHALSIYSNASNAVRLWARSFRNGQMCHRLVAMLSEPSNVVLRGKAALKFGVGLRFAHLCFDIVKTYGRLVKLSYAERTFISLARFARFAPAAIGKWVGGRYLDEF